MRLSPAELERVRTLVAAGEAPAPPDPPIARPTRFALLVDARRRRLEGGRA